MLCRVRIGKTVFLALIALAFSGVVQAEVSLPRVFGDHMVLQRGVPVPVWGTDEPGMVVTVSFAGQRRRGTVDSDGNWLVVLSPLEASSEPRDMRIEGFSNKTISDVLVGEVWVCAGQSNMEWKLSQEMFADEALANASNSEIRLLNLTGAARGGSGVYSRTMIERLTSEAFVGPVASGQCRTQKARRLFSAVGYYFARDCPGSRLGVPVGIINASIGGTPIESWVRRGALEADLLTKGHYPLRPGLRTRSCRSWCRTRAKYNLGRALDEGDDIPGDDIGPNHSFKPTFMWEAGIKPPSSPFAIRGALSVPKVTNADER